MAQPVDTDVLRVHEALSKLALADPRAAQVVAVRYFGRLSDAEAAGVLGVDERTVRRDWDEARLLLEAQYRPADRPVFAPVWEALTRSARATGHVSQAQDFAQKARRAAAQRHA